MKTITLGKADLTKDDFNISLAKERAISLIRAQRSSAITRMRRNRNEIAIESLLHYAYCTGRKNCQPCQSAEESLRE